MEAVSAAKGKGQPPPVLQIALWCGENFLPSAGGIMDQDYSLMWEITVISNVYHTVKKMLSLSGDAINTELSPQERTLLGELYKEGYL